MPDDLSPPPALTMTPQHREAGEALVALLNTAISARCSDIHLRVGQVPFGRSSGKLFRMESPPLTEPLLEAMIEVTARRRLVDATLKDGAFEYSFEQTQTARFRGHAFRQNGSWALALRTIPMQVPSFSELRLPAVVKAFARPQPGLVLITGPTGSGKSTTSAAILDYLAREELCHIVTVEDPIEYVVRGSASCVSQREVGLDTPTFSSGIRAAMREDPDVLFVGEIRDRDSLDAAMNAADTGHMVVSTYHTTSTLHTVRRLVGTYPQEEQSAARERLADSLRGIIAQRLIGRMDNKGRVLCTEVLVNTYSVKECVRDAVKLKGLTQLLEKSTDQNMHSFDQCLTTLVQGRLIDANTALSYATSPGNLRRTFNLSGIK